MELPVSTQAGELLASVLLGAAMGVVYDLLRPLRRGRWTTALTDLLFSLLTLLALLAFLLYAGRGRLRIFAVLGILTGAAIWFLTFSRLFRLFWSGLLRLVTLPLRRFVRITKKISKKSKKL